MKRFKLDDESKHTFDDGKQFIGKFKIEEENLIIDPIIFDEFILELIYMDENLKYMFKEEELNETKKNNMLKRFIPSDHIGQVVTTLELEEYIKKFLGKEEKNLSFYSFFAEGLMGLVLRDIYSLELARGLIDITQTLSGVSQGVDGCFFNFEKKIFILGEAKFYKKFSSGINQVIENFSSKIENKISHLYRISTVDIFDNLSETIIDISKEEFLTKYNINFAGFVLHESNKKRYNYKKDFKTIQEMKANFKKNQKYDVNLVKVYFLHLPIKNKEELIFQLILKADEERSKINGANKIYVE